MQILTRTLETKINKYINKFLAHYKLHRIDVYQSLTISYNFIFINTETGQRYNFSIDCNENEQNLTDDQVNEVIDFVECLDIDYSNYLDLIEHFPHLVNKI